MNQSNMIQNDLEDNPKQIPLLICPFCNKMILRIFLKASNGQIDLYLKCPCIKDYKVISLNQLLKSLNSSQTEMRQCNKHKTKADKYCHTCSEWLCHECILSHNIETGNNHNLVDKELKLKCNKHKKPFSHYCRKRHSNNCIDCLGDHDDHLLITLHSVEYEKVNSKIFNDYKTKTKAVTDSLIKRINSKIEYLNKMKTEIQLEYEANKLINEELELLYQCLFKTVMDLKDYPSYQLMMQPKIVFNTKEYNENKGSIKENYIKLKEHLQTNYVLKLSPTNQLICILSGHQSWVSSLVQLSDGRFASSSGDKTIKFWDTRNHECITTFQGHHDHVYCVIQLLDGRLASGSYDKTIKLWSLAKNECIATLVGHNDFISFLIQLDHIQLASSSADKTIKLWNINSNQCIRTLYGHCSIVQCLLKLKDGRLVSGSVDMLIKIWNTSTNQCITTLEEHTDCVNTLIQLKDGHWLRGHTM